MNIYGYKKRIIDAQRKLKLGISRLGYKQFKCLEKRIRVWKYNIKKLREQRKLKKRK